MKNSPFATILLAGLLAATATITPAHAQNAPSDSESPPCCKTTPPAPSYAPPPGVQPEPTQPAPSVSHDAQEDDGWQRPVGRRFVHGFRIGWTYVMHINRPTREDGMSLANEFKLKSPNMMLLGYEGFYRIVGHSWLNVLMVGNVTIAGLEQSKFIPAGSALLGFEFQRSFQLGIGVNLTPDPQAPSHMIAAAGWTPSVGSIQTPVHFFFVPDTAGNHRMGATVGMSW